MKITNDLALPQPFVSAVERDYSYKPKRYSVTSILKGTKEAILLRRHDEEIKTDVSDMIWAIFGTAVHSILEQAKETDTQIKENKLAVQLPNGYELSGIFDLYDDDTKTVTDYKTGSVWKAIFDEWDDYRKQTLAYVWMLRQIGFDARTGEVVMMLKDHSMTKAQTERNYPAHPVVRKSWTFTDEDLGEFSAWVLAKFAEIERCEQLPDDEIPVCTPEERWAKPTKFAVKKLGNKKATKLFDNMDNAVSYAFELAERDGVHYEVEMRPGEDGKCSRYCNAKDFCNYYKEHYQ